MPEARIGLVGKLPAHGDFVRRGQPAAVLALIDRWLDRELGASVVAGVSLEDAVDGLDGVRGAFAHDGAAVLAALVASGDGVGRRFPLVAILAGAPAARDGADGWCAAAADALAAVRDTGGDADAALAALAAIAPPAMDSSGDIPAAGWWRAGDAAETKAPGDPPEANATPPSGADASTANGSPSFDAAEPGEPVVLPAPAAPVIAAPAPSNSITDTGETAGPTDAAAPARVKRWWRTGRVAVPAATDVAAPRSAAAPLPAGVAFRALLAEARP